MNIRREIAWISVAIFVAIAVEGSVLLKKNLLKPLQDELCFKCKADDRPFYWPLVSYFNQFKDGAVRTVNELLEKAKRHKLA